MANRPYKYGNFSYTHIFLLILFLSSYLIYSVFYSKYQYCDKNNQIEQSNLELSLSDRLKVKALKMR